MTAYQKTGRGGAGNFYSPADLSAAAEARHAADIEAQHPTSSPSTTANPQPTRSTADYAHSGRGGAGNWFSPAAEAQTLPTTTTNTSSQAAAPQPRAAPVERGYGGRGGVGNYYAHHAGEERLRKEEEEMAAVEGDKVRRKVEGEVEKGLQMPKQAVLK
ncbi:MAG: hypothetical protein M1833_000579 [Piccolia ochrophora]|nr:MAG: hypothetical protein M1833_000579 [Piccolia ochrophora]